jgi:hypothetical protein
MVVAAGGGHKKVRCLQGQWKCLDDVPQKVDQWVRW